MGCHKHQDGANMLLIILFIILSPVAALAETFYVDATNGDDANAGTSETAPWKTIAKVNGMVFSPAT
jgi:hypothetical protein